MKAHPAPKVTLGEVADRDGGHQTLQLKGAGPTPYSRRADGLAVLRYDERGCGMSDWNPGSDLTLDQCLARSLCCVQEIGRDLRNRWRRTQFISKDKGIHLNQVDDALEGGKQQVNTVLIIAAVMLGLYLWKKK